LRIMNSRAARQAMRPISSQRGSAKVGIIGIVGIRDIETNSKINAQELVLPVTT
jgi:hypothetical protein